MPAFFFLSFFFGGNKEAKEVGSAPGITVLTVAGCHAYLTMSTETKNKPSGTGITWGCDVCDDLPIYIYIHLEITFQKLYITFGNS